MLSFRTTPNALLPIAVPAPTPPPPPASSIPVTLTPQSQTGNGCGTTALAMALSTITQRPFSQAGIDREIRRGDNFTSAANMRDYARSQGVAASLQNNLSDAEVIAHLDRGRPIIFLSDTTPENQRDADNMHWRALDGYLWDGNDLLLHIVDPSGREYYRGWDELAAEWQAIHALGVNSGYNRFGLVLGASPTDQTLPAERLQGAQRTEPLVDAVNDLVNDLATVRSGEWHHTGAVVLDVVRALFAALLWPLSVFERTHTPNNGKTALAPMPGDMPAPVAVVTQPIATAERGQAAKPLGTFRRRGDVPTRRPEMTPILELHHPRATAGVRLRPDTMAMPPQASLR